MRWALYIGYLTVLGSLGGVAYGVWEIYHQHRQITTAETVEALVLDARVEEESQKSFVLYAPVVEYKYQVDGSTFTSDVVTPTEIAGMKAWAEEVIKAYPIGETVSAKVAPGDPELSFLLSKYGPLPYLTVLVSVVVAAMGGGVILEQDEASDSPSKAITTAAGTQLWPKRDHRRQARAYMLLGCTGLVIGVLVMTHYFSVSTPPHDRLFLVLAGAYGIAVLVLLSWAGIERWKHGGFGTPQLVIDTSTPRLGDSIDVSVAIPTYFYGSLKSLTLRLDCEVKDRTIFDISGHDRGKVLMRQRELVLYATPVTRHGEVGGRVEFRPPANLEPSTPTDEKSNLHVVWTLYLAGEANLKRSINAEYVLNVMAAAA